MAYAPIALTIPEYDRNLYSNWWLKAYVAGTTTPLAMATDATGGTTAAKYELDTQGFPITAGGARLIPFINGDYDLWLFPTAAEADANDTTNAIQFADNLNADPLSESVAMVSVDTVALLRLETPDATVATYLESHTTANDGGGGNFNAVTGAAIGTYVDNNGTIIVPTGGDGSAAWLRELAGFVTPEMFGAVGDGATDDQTALLAVIAYADSIAAGVECGSEKEYLTSANLEIKSTGNVPKYFNGNGSTFTALAGCTKIFDVETPHLVSPIFYMQNMVLESNSIATNAFKLLGSQKCSYDNIQCKNSVGADADLEADTSGKGLFNNRFHLFTTGGAGVNFNDTSAGHRINGNTGSIHVLSSTSYGVNLEYAIANTFFIDVEGSQTDGLILTAVLGLSATLYIENFGLDTLGTSYGVNYSGTANFNIDIIGNVSNDSAGRFGGTLSKSGNKINIQNGSRVWDYDSSVDVFEAGLVDPDSTTPMVKFSSDGNLDIGINGSGANYVKIGDSAWDGIPFRAGPNYMWVDSLAQLRLKNGVPASEYDGQAINRGQSTTSAAFNLITNSINTTDKYGGKMAWSTTLLRPVWATSSAAGAIWVYADGTTAYTPV